MLGLAPGFFRSAVAAPDPAAIFGANLTAWYDSSAGITPLGSSPDRVARWDEQSGNGRWATNTTPSTNNSPQYIAVDVDGTPSVWFAPGEGLTTRALLFSAGFVVSPAQTCYAFVDLPPASIAGLIWSGGGNAGFFTYRGNTAGTRTPGVFNGTFSAWVGTDPTSGWVLIRFGGNNVGPIRLLNLDADVEQSFAASWPGTSPAWTRISRSDSSQHFFGKIKQLVFTDTLVTDADAEHAAMLAYIKARYPTLVTY